MEGMSKWRECPNGLPACPCPCAAMGLVEGLGWRVCHGRVAGLGAVGARGAAAAVPRVLEDGLLTGMDDMATSREDGMASTKSRRPPPQYATSSASAPACAGTLIQTLWPLSAMANPDGAASSASFPATAASPVTDVTAPVTRTRA